MLSSTKTRAFTGAGLLFTLTLISAAGPVGFTANSLKSSKSELATTFTEPTISGANASASPDPLSSTSVYYTIRPDLRRCAQPMCGGYWVKRVNASSTRCADGRWSRECYVSEIDWNNQPEIDRGSAPRALLRGILSQRGFSRRRNFGIFRVSESWTAAGSNMANGILYRGTDRNIRCITFPCPTHHAAKLNSTISRDIAGVDLSGAGASNESVNEASTAMTTSDGVIASGFFTRVTGPAGKGEALKATQFYLRSKTAIGKKACIKTGCSNAVCADEPRITTCEWRPEYACYQRARCERQPDGECGFTKTAELTACLARK